jgi:hypothetical protein
MVAICSTGSVYAQNPAVSSRPLNVNFSVQEYLNNYVIPKVEEWGKKGRYESSEEYVLRVTEQKRDALIKQLTDEALTTLKERITQNVDWKHLAIGDYDADNQTFWIKSSQFGDFLLKVPTKEAEAFEKSFASTQKTNPDFYFTKDGKIKLNQLTFKTTSKETYIYNSADPTRFNTVAVNHNFGKINVDFDAEEERAPNKGEGSTIIVGKSDVDINIPTTTTKNDKTFAVIIANENYQRESQVIFAKNDGETFKKYCIQTLGLPEKNVHLVTNATLNNIRGEINWISGVANAYKGEARIIFYYAGHGIPDESSKTAYLLPIDGYGSDVETGYKLDDLYSKLGEFPAKNITVFMDACFSGAQRSGDMLASARGVAIKTSQGKPSGNMVVFSAAQGDETAYPYKEKGHGLFTYFLLKKLQETKGDVTLGELSNYITNNVQQQSIVVNNKSQTPTVIPSTSLVDWQSLKLK